MESQNRVDAGPTDSVCLPSAHSPAHSKSPARCSSSGGLRHARHGGSRDERPSLYFIGISPISVDSHHLAQIVRDSPVAQSGLECAYEAALMPNAKGAIELAPFGCPGEQSPNPHRGNSHESHRARWPRQVYVLYTRGHGASIQKSGHPHKMSSKDNYQREIEILQAQGAYFIPADAFITPISVSAWAFAPNARTAKEIAAEVADAEKLGTQQILTMREFVRQQRARKGKKLDHPLGEMEA